MTSPPKSVESVNSLLQSAVAIIELCINLGPEIRWPLLLLLFLFICPSSFFRPHPHSHTHAHTCIAYTYVTLFLYNFSISSESPLAKFSLCPTQAVIHFSVFIALFVQHIVFCCSSTLFYPYTAHLFRAMSSAELSGRRRHPVCHLTDFQFQSLKSVLALQTRSDAILESVSTHLHTSAYIHSQPHIRFYTCYTQNSIENLFYKILFLIF